MKFHFFKAFFILNISVDVQQIVDINDLNLNFVVKFRLKLTWFDVQLMWVNLKKSRFQNFLNEEEKKMIWMPKIRMESSKNIKPIRFE